MARRSVVLSGPSACGKSTLLKKLMQAYPSAFGFSVSHTTRRARPGEVDGRDYHFVDRKAMEQAIENGDFIEHAEYSGNLYGTSKSAVESVARTGRICVLDVDSEGVKSIRKAGLSARFIYVAPPSVKKLEERLRQRGTEDEESVRRRMSLAVREMEFATQPHVYDHKIVNDDLEIAFEKLRGILFEDIQAVLNGGIVHPLD